MDHTINATIIKIKVAKVDLTAGIQRTFLYQHVQQFVQLPPTWLGDLIELTSAHQALNPL